MVLRKKTCLQRVLLLKVIVRNFINKENSGSCKKKECKRIDHKIKLVEEIKKNI